MIAILSMFMLWPDRTRCFINIDFTLIQILVWRVPVERCKVSDNMNYIFTRLSLSSVIHMVLLLLLYNRTLSKEFFATEFVRLFCN